MDQPRLGSSRESVLGAHRHLSLDAQTHLEFVSCLEC